MTPEYVINLSRFSDNCNCISSAFSSFWGSNLLFGYSVKTNRDPQLIKYAYEKLGWFIETVSPDEYRYATKLGIDCKKIILNGPCKKNFFKEAAVKGSIIILDNLSEVGKFCTFVDSKQNKKLSFRVGLRINFDLEKECPGETTAGSSASRFGICYENNDFKKALLLLKKSNIHLSGIHVHISTLTRSLNVFKKISKTIARIIKEFSLSLSFVDLGGGFFGGQIVEGKPKMTEYAKVITKELLNSVDPKRTMLVLEPGASVIATSVTYRTSVISVRNIRNEIIVTVDGSVLHINPFLQQRSPVYCIKRKGKTRIRKKCLKQTVCGSTCMEKDRFVCLEDDYPLKVGDVFEFKNAGAYTMTFNSHFILPIPRRRYIYEGE